jgi:hypothetical protein
MAEKQKRHRTGPDSGLLAENAKEDVTLAEGKKRRTTTETPKQSGTSAVGGKGKDSDKAIDENLNLDEGMGGFTVLGATSSALSRLDPPVHDPCNARMNSTPPVAKIATMHNAVRGIRLETHQKISSHNYVNLAGPEAIIGEAVELDALNAIVKQIKQQSSGTVADLTKAIQQTNPDTKEQKCTCMTQWKSGMLGKNNSGAMLLVYFPDNSKIDEIEKIIAAMQFPDCSARTRPMNVCFIDMLARYQCKCMSGIMNAVLFADKITLILVAMCDPTSSRYTNVNTSDMTEFIFSVNETLTKMRSMVNLSKMTSDCLMEKIEESKEAMKAASDVIRIQQNELESNKWAMFCLANTTNNVEALQQMLNMKSTFTRLLDIPGDDSGESVAAIASPETDSNVADPDEMPRLFLELVKLMPDKKFEEMRALVLSAPLVTKAIDERVASKVKDIQISATEAEIEARVASAVRAKEAEIEARVASAVRAKEAEIEARVATAVEAHKIEIEKLLRKKFNGFLRDNLESFKELFREASKNHVTDPTLDQKVSEAWDEAFEEMEKGPDFTCTETVNDTAQTGAAAAAARTAATVDAKSSASWGGDWF